MKDSCRLVTLWDMLKVYADGFLYISGMLNTMLDGLRIQRKHPEHSDLTKPLTDLVNIRKSLSQIKGACDRCGLRLSSLLAVHILNDHLQKDCFASELLESDLEQLSCRIEDELSIGHFLQLNSEEESYFNFQVSSLGEAVERNLASIAEDFDEAAKCYGLGRYTACVFHLMRLMESCIRRFGEKLGIDLIDSRNKEKHWQNILDEANKAIAARDKNDPLTKKLSGIAALLYCVKLAWRNEVMHPKETYTQDEARVLIAAVTAYVKEIASVL